jgi:hypothetical protein
MSAPVFNLDVIDIASPCHVPWESMAGTERVRFCDQCRLSVYNLSELDRAAAETLVRAHEGRLCVRFYRRPDGRVMTRDCADVRSDQAFIRRLAAVLGVFLASLISLLGFVLAVEGGREPSAKGIRGIEPFKSILNWIDPTPTSQATMGVPCFVRPPAPATRPEVAPPPRPVEQSSASES